MCARKLRGSPLAVSPGFRRFVLDQLEELGGVVPRAMFGGIGLYREGLFFGIVAGDVLYLKVDDRTRQRYEAAGMRPFKPYPHRSGTMQYYAVPVGVLESAAELAEWARRAVDVARAAAEGPRRNTQVRRRSSA
jgi:DNA transformation protein